MNTRSSMLFLLLGAGLLPYFLSAKSPLREALTSPLKYFTGEAATTSSTAAPQAAPTATAAPTGEAGQPSTSPFRTVSRSTDGPTVGIEQVLRWDVTPAWVMGNWPRVTTHLADLGLQGYRFPLVTGTAEHDVAGSLTYYFDGTQKLERIAFQGTTGDPRQLVLFLTQRHHFERRLSNDPGLYLYQVEYDERALSETRIRAAPVVRSGAPYARFEISLTMNRPKE